MPRKFFTPAFLVVLLALLALCAFASASKQQQQQQQNNNNRRQHPNRISDVAARSLHNPIPPSSASMANDFAAKPHGDRDAIVATTSGGSPDRVGTKQQQQQPRGKLGVYLQPSAAYQEAFSQLGRGNMTAVRELHELAAAGDGHAMMLLGVLYGSGVGVPASASRSRLYHTFAALSGIAESIVVLAMDEEQNGNCDAAVEWAKQAADISARFNSDGTITPRWDASRLTQLEHKHATTTESEFDVQLLLAERGNGPACCAVGYAYMLGLNGVEQDGGAAKMYFERGMDLGEAACFSGMGQLYARGVSGSSANSNNAATASSSASMDGASSKVIRRDPKLAERYYRLGAEKNHAPSLNGLGYLYAAGALSEDGQRDFENAAKYFEQSAALNNAPGTYNMGLLHLNGKGVPRDTHKALQKFQRAASMGSLLATYQLGNMFAVGAAPIARSCNVALGHFNQVQRMGPWNLRWNMARAALTASAGGAAEPAKLHEQQQQQGADGASHGGGSIHAGKRLPPTPGEALLHYLILGAMGRPKAAQNAMFVVERYFPDESHPLVSFNGTSGSVQWRDDALTLMAEREAAKRISAAATSAASIKDGKNQLSNNVKKSGQEASSKPPPLLLLLGDASPERDDTAELLRAIAHELTTGSYRSVILHSLVRAAARHGSADAKLDLASHYWDGIGTPRSHAKAREAYRAAAQEGSVEAMWTLGWLHSTTEEEQDEYFHGAAPTADVLEEIERTYVALQEHVAALAEQLLAERKLRMADSDNDNGDDLTVSSSSVSTAKSTATSPPPSSSSSSSGRKGAGASASSSSASRAVASERRRRRITGLPGFTDSLGSAGAPVGSSDPVVRADATAASASGASSASRHKRDIHRAKHYYDQVAEMFPSSWFAVRLALIRLNFLWWYDHFLASPPSHGSLSSWFGGSSSAAPASGQDVAGSVQSPTRKETPALPADSAGASDPTATAATADAIAEDVAKKRGSGLAPVSMKQVYRVTRRLAHDFVRMVDPTVAFGMSLADVLILSSVAGLVALLLIRHHAFGV